MMRKSVWGVASAALIALSICASPASAYAETSHDISKGDVVLRAESGTCQGHVITGSTSRYELVIESGEHTVTLDNAHLDEDYYAFGGEGARSGITVQQGATLHLKLIGENSASSYRGGSEGRAGVNVEVGATLIIDGPGRLVARGTGGSVGGAAGIGGDYNYDFGNIIINSGDIEAHAGGGAAGIGAGYDLEGPAGYDTAYGNVTINGGRVAAYGGQRGLATGAGIGAGENGDYAGVVTINGGAVYALGGDSDTPSIGGGGHWIGSTGNGTFTTGVNGNALILAPNGIGDVSKADEWDGFFIGYGASFENADETFDSQTGEITGITFNSNTVDVYGEPVVDYDITINAPATMRVTTVSDRTHPATLTMAEGTTLTNNNEASQSGAAGINLQPGSKLVLMGGIEQCKGSGTMVANEDTSSSLPEGVVQLPITESLVSLEYDSTVYDGTEKKPTVTVKLNKWSYEQLFDTPKEYNFTYDKNINVGIADVNLSANPGSDSNLLKSDCTVHFQITMADYGVNVRKEWTVQEGEQNLLSKLPKMSFPANTPQVVQRGTLKWYVDEQCTTELADGAVAGLSDGDTQRVYWKYTQNGDTVNYPDHKTGYTDLHISKYPVPNAAIFIDGKQEESLHKVYGDQGVTLSAMIDIERDGSFAPVDTGKSTVTWSTSNAEVATVDQAGKLTFTGQGEADITVAIGAYDSGTDSGNYAAVKAMIHVVVDPKPIAVDLDSVAFTSRPYDGTRVVIATAKLEDGAIVSGDEQDVILEVEGRVVSPVVGKNKRAFALFSLSGSPNKVDDYVLTPAYSEGVVDITKAVPGPGTLEPKTGGMTVYNGLDHTYNFDLTALDPDTKDLGNGDFMQAGDIDYKVKSVKLSDDSYFTVDDITVNNQSNVLTVTVHDVDSVEEGVLGTIEVVLTSSNFEDMVTTITVNRENPEAIYTVTAKAGKGGSITPEGVVEYLKSETPVYTVTPDEGYEIEDVVVDGKSVGAVSSYTFEALEGDHTIEASFRKSGTVDPVEPGDGNDGDHTQGGNSTENNGGSTEKLAETGDSTFMTIASLGVIGVVIGVVGVVMYRKRQQL